ncbi:MAG TPA: thiol peroxidase [Porphyromonadaceae bacterium]|nr:thiol peroxidase [Porphyromonadaceae bacterium]
MAKITLKGNEINTTGNMPNVGTEAPDVKLVKADLSELALSDLRGKRVVMNIFPSLDTDVCATSVRKFNEAVSKMPNTVVLAISKDLPFAQARFCTVEGIKNVIPLSGFRCNCLEEKYGLGIADGPLRGLYARAVVVLDENGKILYEELVPEIVQEPNYEAVIATLK